MCLPDVPQWGQYNDQLQQSSYIYGSEYQTHANNPFLATNTRGASLQDHSVPCALCHVSGRGTVMTIPAWKECPSGWQLEYDGYMMAEHHGHTGRVGPVCVDEAPEVLPGSHGDQNGVLFYPIEIACGSLPCPNYINGREITCAVCTR